jgi:hypothetical protein
MQASNTPAPLPLDVIEYQVGHVVLPCVCNGKKSTALPPFTAPTRIVRRVSCRKSKPHAEATPFDASLIPVTLNVISALGHKL